MIPGMAEKVVEILTESGPLTGAELRDAAGVEGFALWKECSQSGQIAMERVGRRYLRLDRNVDGYARLSPSILREFLTYCVVGVADQAESLREKRESLASHIAEVSAAKVRLARRIVEDIGRALLPPAGGREERYGVLLAGDIVYGMGHDAPRSERSTGQLVRGSDLDLVVITRDDVPEELGRSLDDLIYREKYRHLNNPAFREEIDYVVKPLARMREQAGFDTFKHMVSCKILDEAVLVYGSEELFETAKGLLVESGVSDELARLERSAVETRAKAEARLLEMSDAGPAGDELYLFYTSEESEEFE